MTFAASLLVSLLALYPHTPARRCLEARAPMIAAALADAEATYGVPAGVLLSVGFLESHLACDPRSGGSWGNARDARHRHVAGRPDGAARILARGFRLHGTWLGAVHFFRCGYPRGACPRLVGYEAPYALALTERIYARAGLAAPAQLR